MNKIKSLNKIKSQDRKYFKMYKSGKQWIFSGIAVFGVAVFTQVERVSADQIPVQTFVQDVHR